MLNYEKNDKTALDLLDEAAKSLQDNEKVI